jgi:hypothetical protein
MTKTIDSVTIHYLADTGRVYKMSDWAKADALVDAGHLTYKFYGPKTYGHVDFFIA